MRKLILCFLCFVGLCFGQIQQAPPAVINFDDHTGFVQIFDGATLTNWDGAKDVWRVEDGAIVAESRPKTCRYDIFLSGSAVSPAISN
jgi:hypothetical protein